MGLRDARIDIGLIGILLRRRENEVGKARSYRSLAELCSTNAIGTFHHSIYDNFSPRSAPMTCASLGLYSQRAVGHRIVLYSCHWISCVILNHFYRHDAMLARNMLRFLRSPVRLPQASVPSQRMNWLHASSELTLSIPRMFTDTSKLIRFHFWVFFFFPLFSCWFRAIDKDDLCQLLSAC